MKASLVGLRTPPAILALLSLTFALLFAVYFVITGYATQSPDDAFVRHTGWPGWALTLIGFSFALGPLIALVGLTRGSMAVALVGLVLYASQSLLFGFSLGGPHLVVGVPLLLLAVAVFYVRRRRNRAAPGAGTS